MRLSNLLEKGILNSNIGVLLNNLGVRSRRSVLFFEDILAVYIKKCEDTGYGKEMETLGRRWGSIGTKTFTPRFLGSIPKPLYVNIAKKVWKQINIISDGKIMEKDDNYIKFKTKNEFITRIVGKNRFVTGFFIGCLEALYGKRMELVKFSFKTKKWSIYHLRIGDELEENINKKSKMRYNSLNRPQRYCGPNLKNAVREDIFQLNKNAIYFRKKSVLILENTVFHMISNSGILLDKVAGISYEFFNEVIDKDSTEKEKLNILKTLLQVMGWGEVKIAFGNRIILNIKNPPHGLQKENDNWGFLIRTILGFLWLINKDFNVTHAKSSYRTLRITYSA